MVGDEKGGKLLEFQRDLIGTIMTRTVEHLHGAIECIASDFNGIDRSALVRHRSIQHAQRIDPDLDKPLAADGELMAHIGLRKREIWLLERDSLVATTRRHDREHEATPACLAFDVYEVGDVPDILIEGQVGAEDGEIISTQIDKPSQILLRLERGARFKADDVRHNVHGANLAFAHNWITCSTARRRRSLICAICSLVVSRRCARRLRR